MSWFPFGRGRRESTSSGATQEDPLAELPSTDPGLFGAEAVRASDGGYEPVIRGSQDGGYDGGYTPLPPDDGDSDGLGLDADSGDEAAANGAPGVGGRGDGRGGSARTRVRERLRRVATSAVSLSDLAVQRLTGGSTELLGLWLFVVSTLFGTGMSLCAKILNAQGFSVFEVVWVRSLTLLIVTIPELWARRINPFADKKRRWLYALRGALGFGSVSTLYGAVSLLPMADANTLAFLAPLWAALLSPAILGEIPSPALIAALPVSLAGVLLVAQPSFLFGLHGGRTSLLGIFVGLAQSLFSATAKMAVRALNTSDESMSAIIFSMGAVSILGATIGTWATGGIVWPSSWMQICLLAANGIAGLGNQVTQTAALQRAKAASAIAMSYLSVIWGLLLDIFLFHAAPTWLSVLGAAIICGASFAVAFWEHKVKSRRAASRTSLAALNAAARMDDDDDDDDRVAAAADLIPLIEQQAERTAT